MLWSRLPFGRPGDGLAMPWPSNFQVDGVLCVPKLRRVFAMSSETWWQWPPRVVETQDSVLCAWHCGDGCEIWRKQTGLKLLQPLYFIEPSAAHTTSAATVALLQDQLDALCAGCFEGVVLWAAATGILLRRIDTELPVDRVWFGAASLLCARSSEVLGLTSKLLVWNNLQDADATGDLTRLAWSKTTTEMIMALTSAADALFARLGQALVSYSHAGQQRWQRQEQMLPRLPTVPTRLQLSGAKLLVAAGHLILALSLGCATKHEWTVGSVVKVYPAWCNSMATWHGSSNYALGFLNLSEGDLQLTSLRRGEIPKASIAWGSGLAPWRLHGPCDVSLAVACSKVILAVIWDACDDESSLLTWDSSGRLLWEQHFENTLQTLGKDDHFIFAGRGVGFITALNPHDGSVLWHTEIDGMAKALTLITEEKRAKQVTDGGCQPVTLEIRLCFVLPWV
eukprot:Skav206892  [mRNA]  locus=scaffold2387:118488:130753:+ [translate_table: standard]